MSNSPLYVTMADTSFGERVWIVQGVEQDLRTDGRSRLSYRPLGVEANIIAQADGSARLHLGSTYVLVGVKVNWQRTASAVAAAAAAVGCSALLSKPAYCCFSLLC